MSLDELIDVADDSPEALLAAYAERGWGDGLPLVAPTPERVDAMLYSTQWLRRSCSQGG